MKNYFKLILMGVLIGASACSGNDKKTEVQGSISDGVTVQQIDDMRLITLRDNKKERFMPNKLFYGTSDSALVEQLSTPQGVSSSVSCFLVEKDGKKILFDAGLGVAAGGQLLDLLDSLKIKPSEIDYLMLTHFHGDHIGGMLRGDSAVFSGAEVYASIPECDFWTSPEVNNRLVSQMVDVYGDRLHRFAFTDNLPCDIVPILAEGHTPGHTVYQLGKLLIVGDLMHGAAIQLPHPEICAAYDMDKEKAIQSRKQVLEYAKENGLKVCGMHLPDNGVLK